MMVLASNVKKYEDKEELRKLVVNVKKIFIYASIKSFYPIEGASAGCHVYN